jgi:hypothetical protein
MRATFAWAPLLLLASFSGATVAGELVILGAHASEGRDGDGPYEGTVTIRSDATYVDARTYADGRTQTLAGAVRVVERGLELRGAAGARRFARADTERQVRWRWSGAAGAEQWILQAEPKEPRLRVLRRMLQRPKGATRWLFENNLGAVDPNPDRLILRSRQPSPQDVVDLQERYGLKTIVSLNGDQNDDVRYTPSAGPDGRRPQERTVNLARFIRERGIRHETFSLSASRAPTDAELRAIFKLLRDDATKPLLIHCRGGSDRTGVVGALYAIEFLGQTEEQAKATMREHMWAADGGTEIQGAVVDLYQPGHLRRLLGTPARAWF